MASITKRYLDSLKTDDPRGYHVPDDELQGFGVTVFRSGKRTFWIRYQKGSIRRRVTFGEFGSMTVQEAREAAKGLLAQVRLAKVGQAVDPATARERVAATPGWAAWTETYVTEVRKKKKSGIDDVRYLGLAEEGGEKFRLLRERWSARLITDVLPADIRTFHDSLSDTPVLANRWLASIRACFSEAQRRDLVALNPAVKVKAFREAPPRARVLTAEERIALCAAIEQEEDPHAAGALRLLMLTGMRLSEVLHARWDDIDLEGGTWRIPSPKAGRPQTIPTWPAAAEALKAIPRGKADVFIIRGRSPLKPRADLKRPWASVLKRAGLEKAGITVHDLRRDVGKFLVDNFGAHVAQSILRHADIRTTVAVYGPTSVSESRRALASRVLNFPKRESA